MRRVRGPCGRWRLVSARQMSTRVACVGCGGIGTVMRVRFAPRRADGRGVMRFCSHECMCKVFDAAWIGDAVARGLWTLDAMSDVEAQCYDAVHYVSWQLGVEPWETLDGGAARWARLLASPDALDVAVAAGYLEPVVSGFYVRLTPAGDALLARFLS